MDDLSYKVTSVYEFQHIKAEDASLHSKTNEINRKSYRVTNLQESPSLKAEDNRLTMTAFPEFVLHDTVILQYWDDLKNIFPDHQLLLIDKTNDKVMAAISTFPLCYCKEDFSVLSDEGVRWGVRQSFKNYQDKDSPNILFGALVSIDSEYKDKGLSNLIVTEMINFTKSMKYNQLIIPLRPSLKHKYPLHSIEEYMGWQRSDSLPFDPWLRAHVKQGANIIKPSLRSSCTIGSLAEWKRWTQMDFPADGKYIIPGALVPIEVSISEDLATYSEPNIWIFHDNKP